MALYEDIFDDDQRVPKIKYPYFYVIVLKNNEHDAIPNFVFNDFKKFFDTYDLFSYQKKIEKFGRLEPYSNVFSARLPLLKRFLNRQEESEKEYNKLFIEGDNIQITELMEERKINEFKKSMFM